MSAHMNGLADYGDIDPDAPPDLLSLVDDGVDRKPENLQVVGWDDLMWCVGWDGLRWCVGWDAFQRCRSCVLMHQVLRVLRARANSVAPPVAPSAPTTLTRACRRCPRTS